MDGCHKLEPAREQWTERNAEFLRNPPEDYYRLMNLARYQDVVDKTADTALKVNISWHFFYPGSSTVQWQLDGVIRALKVDGYAGKPTDVDQLAKEIERELARVQWAPRLNVSAMTGRSVDKLAPALHTALEGWETRISTGQLNSFLGRLIAEHPHPVRSGKQAKILFGTQATTSPPTFVLFTSGPLEASYVRFIERRLREEFGFVGTPIEIKVQPREKRGRR